MRIFSPGAYLAIPVIFGLLIVTHNPDVTISISPWRLAAAEPTDDVSKPSTAHAELDTQDAAKHLVIVQVRNETYLPGRSNSDRVDDYSAIVKDGWYHPADESFRLRVPVLHSGNINIMRRRWEKPDGIDVKVVDEDAYWRAVFSVETDIPPGAQDLKKKYADYLATQNTRYEAEIISTRFGDTLETVAMNWVSTRDFPYDAPSINVSAEKMAKVGPTVGISWTFWKYGAQCGFSMIMPIDRTLDDAAAFQLAKMQVKKFSDGLEFTESKP